MYALLYGVRMVCTLEAMPESAPLSFYLSGWDAFLSGGVHSTR